MNTQVDKRITSLVDTMAHASPVELGYSLEICKENSKDFAINQAERRVWAAMVKVVKVASA